MALIESGLKSNWSSMTASRIKNPTEKHQQRAFVGSYTRWIAKHSCGCVLQSCGLDEQPLW